MSASDGKHFALEDTETKASSGWLTIGDTFAGYKISSFDADDDVLNIQKGGETLHLRLRDSKTGDSSASKPRPSREKVLEHMATRWTASKVVVRAKAEIRNGRVFYVCTEIWKECMGGPRVGDSLPGVVLQGPQLENFKPYDTIVFLEAYPADDSTSKSFHPINEKGNLSWCYDMSAEELRDYLKSNGG